MMTENTNKTENEVVVDQGAATGTNIQLSFFQYHFSGELPDQAVSEIDSVVAEFEKITNEFGAQNVVANAIARFAANEEGAYQVIPLLIASYFYKNPEKSKDKDLIIDLAELAESFEINLDQIIEVFDIKVIQPNKVMSIDLNDIENLPPELQEVVKQIKQAKESGDDNCNHGVLQVSETGEVKSISQAEYDEEFGEGAYENSIPEMFKEAAKIKSEKALNEHSNEPKEADAK